MCPAPRAVAFDGVLRRGDIQQLTSNTGPVAQAFRTANYGYNLRFPVVPALAQPADPRYLHPHVLSIMLRHKLPIPQDVQVWPPVQVPEHAAEIVSDLVNHLNDMQYCDISSTVSFRSTVVQKLLPQPSSHDDEPGTSPAFPAADMSIMPCGAMLPVECAMLTSYSEVHLLTGVRVYVVFPAIPSNMERLEDYLDCMARGYPQDHDGLCEVSLFRGVTFVQRPGQIVYLPPFCPTAVFATKTSAAVVLRSRRFEGIPFRICHIDMTATWISNLHRHDPERLWMVLEIELMQLWLDLDTLLSDTAIGTPDFAHSIDHLGVEWLSKASKFRELLEKYIPKVQNEIILRNVPKLWTILVERTGREYCPICWTTIKELEVSFVDHFSMLHWNKPEAKKPVRPTKVSSRSNNVAMIKRGLTVASGNKGVPQVKKPSKKKARIEPAQTISLPSRPRTPVGSAATKAGPVPRPSTTRQAKAKGSARK